MPNGREFGTKCTYVTRTIPANADLAVGPPARAPWAGDLVVARVTAIAEHDHIEDPRGRKVRVYPGDLIVGAYGNRYATDVFEGYVPTGPRTHLLTAGGLIGTVTASHDAHAEPTSLEVIGSLTLGGHSCSLEDFVRPVPPSADPVPRTVVVVGSGMNAGKTTTVASIVRGLVIGGLAAGAGKVTGSGSGKDRWAYADAGACALADFLDFGMASTFGYPLERLGSTMVAIRDALGSDGAEVAVLEIADGLLQPETAWLVERLPGFADAVVFAATDALSARAGVDVLRGLGLPVRAVSGLVTRSPLASREASTATLLPVVSPVDLVKGAALELLAPELEYA
jgi:hypothetical protein